MTREGLRRSPTPSSGRPRSSSSTTSSSSSPSRRSRTSLLDDLTWRGAGQSALLLLVVWWSWNYTTWVTNELDPESPVVRLLMIGIMLASLMMAAAIPDAFGDKAGLFIGPYLAIQLGRAHVPDLRRGRARHARARAGRAHPHLVRRGRRVLDRRRGRRGHGRTVLWLIALAIDYGGPLALFWVPGRSDIGETAWQVSTATSPSGSGCS